MCSIHLLIKQLVSKFCCETFLYILTLGYRACVARITVVVLCVCVCVCNVLREMLDEKSK